MAHVAERAGQVTLFQRTAPYVLPKPDRKITLRKHSTHRNIPLARKLVRGDRLQRVRVAGRRTVEVPPAVGTAQGRVGRASAPHHQGPRAAGRLTPDYPIGCKRILFDNTYYGALARPNVNVETGDIKKIGENYVVTNDGTRHEIDTLILGTGFAASGFLAPMEIRGRGNRELSAAWRDGAEAYLGITVSGFPNLFMLYGPNTNLGHNSIVYMLESQIQYVKDAIANLHAAPGTSFDVKSDVQNSFNAKLQHALRNTVWAEGCKSWYIAESGKIVNNWSGFTFTYRRLTSRFDTVNYHALAPSTVVQLRHDTRQAMPLQPASATA